jgi:hypothetical protein
VQLGVRKNIIFGLLLSFATQFINIAVAQDDLTPPPGFEFNQSRYQSFYILKLLILMVFLCLKEIGLHHLMVISV